MTEHTSNKPVYEANGEPMGFRVLPDEGKGPALEISERQMGTFLGHEVTNLVTYRMTPTPDGTMKGEGQGIATLKDGSMTFWTGKGEGKQTGPEGPTNWNVTIMFRNPTGKFAEFKDRPLTGSYVVDAAWKSKGSLFAKP